MRRDETLLVDVYESARQVAEYLEGHSRKTFLSDARTRDAVERRILVMGEAVSRMSGEFKEAHPEIPWQRLTSLRNFYVHGYEKLQADDVWGTAKGLVRNVERQLAKLIPNDENQDPEAE
jgi:uncharacterized protein with HEPN domain